MILLNIRSGRLHKNVTMAGTYFLATVRKVMASIRFMTMHRSAYFFRYITLFSKFFLSSLSLITPRPAKDDGRG